MTPPKKADLSNKALKSNNAFTSKKDLVPKRATGRKSKGEEKFFDQYVWHHKVHENLRERLRYFLLKVSPYDEGKLIAALSKLVSDKKIGGLRAYRVFGRNDLMIRCWMEQELYDGMGLIFHKYLERDHVTVGGIKPDYVTMVKHRWYWEKTPPNTASLEKNAELMINLRLDHDLFRRLESGKNEDADLFKKYLKQGLIIYKQSTQDTITFFICVKLSDSTLEQDTERLVSSIKKEISNRKRFLYPEIDLATRSICDLMIRARTENYFEIGELIKWLSPQVGSTETYLSIMTRPVTGDSIFSRATLIALDPPDPLVEVIFPKPYYPDGPYPTSEWGKIGEEVVNYLKGKHLNPPHGLKTVLHDFLLAVLQKNPSSMCSALLTVYKPLEGYLKACKRDYLEGVGVDFEVVFNACFSKEQDENKRNRQEPPKSRDKLALGDLFYVYYRGSHMAKKPISTPDRWNSFVELRNWAVHGNDYKWEDAKDKWKDHANTMIHYWPEVQSLLKEISIRSKSLPESVPDLFV